MNYRVLIQNRKSVRAFSDQQIPQHFVEEIRDYHGAVERLIPDLETELHLYTEDVRAALEGAAGYNQFLVGAPHYLVLLSDPHPQAQLNAGYVMQDMLLKLTDMGLDTCWVTFTDSDLIKASLGLNSHREVMAIAAFGYGAKTTKRLRLNIRSMSNIDISAKRHYVEPKRGIHDMVFLNTWGNIQNLDDHIGFFDDMLWESFYAASQSPSYLNRQAYGFIIHDGAISLVKRPDIYNTELDSNLSLGIVLLHFTKVAECWAGPLHWHFGSHAAHLPLPEGHKVVATCIL